MHIIPIWHQWQRTIFSSHYNLSLWDVNKKKITSNNSLLLLCLQLGSPYQGCVYMSMHAKFPLLQLFSWHCVPATWNPFYLFFFWKYAPLDSTSFCIQLNSFYYNKNPIYSNFFITFPFFIKWLFSLNICFFSSQNSSVYSLFLFLHLLFFLHLTLLWHQRDSHSKLMQNTLFNLLSSHTICHWFISYNLSISPWFSCNSLKIYHLPNALKYFNLFSF